VARQEHNAAVARQTVIGKVGIVSTAIRGGDLPGEVRVVVEGIPHYYLGYAATALPAGTKVLVINNRGARQIDVEPWPTVPPDGHARGVPEGQ
jgi:membrane protein implicated in regulation of membrane protease activity